MRVVAFLGVAGTGTLAIFGLGVIAGLGAATFRGQRLSAYQSRLAPAAMVVVVAALIAYLWIRVPNQPDLSNVVKWNDAQARRADWAEALSILFIVLGLLLTWLFVRPQTVAAQQFDDAAEGAEATIKAGEYVPDDVAARVPDKTVFIEKWVAKEGFQDGSTWIPQGEDVSGDVAQRPEVQPHVGHTRTATIDFVYRTSTTRSYAQGVSVPPDVAARHPDSVTTTLTPAPLGLLIGTDGRWSTSKVTMALWTLTLGWALLALLLATQALHVALTLKGGHSNFSNLDLPDQYYLLLGGPFAAMVLAKTFTTTKVEDGTIVKTEKTPDTNPLTGLNEVLSTDSGSTDLVDSQYFLFNVIALVYFGIVFIGGLRHGLPDIPEVIFGLTSAAALTYTAKKAVERSAAFISAVTPTTARARTKVRVYGRNLAIGGAPPAITVGGRTATTVETLSHGPDQDILSVTLPALEAGTAPLIAVPTGLTPTPAVNLTIQATSISALTPEPVSLRPGSRFVIAGSGFGETPGSAQLGENDLSIVSWSEDTIIAEVRAGVVYATVASGSLLLTVSSGEGHTVRNAAVEAFAVSRVEPPQITNAPGQTGAVFGLGFMGYASIGVTIGATPVVVTRRSDTEIAFKLDTASYQVGSDVPLTVTAYLSEDGSIPAYIAGITVAIGAPAG